jgi:hypothetical protein
MVRLVVTIYLDIQLIVRTGSHILIDLMIAFNMLNAKVSGTVTTRFYLMTIVPV